MDSGDIKKTIAGGFNKIGILIVVAMVLFILVSIVLSFIVSLKVSKRFKLGKRLTEECGREYLEAETDKFMLNELLESRTTTSGKIFRMIFTLLKVTILCILALVWYGVIFMSGSQVAFKTHKISAILLTIFIMSSIGTFIGIWIAILSKHENNVYYVTKPEDVQESKKKYMKALIATTSSIGGTMILSCFGLWLWYSSSATMPAIDKTFYGNVAMYLFAGAVLLLLMFAIMMIYVTQYINLISVVKTDYIAGLIEGANNLKSNVQDSLYRDYIPEADITGTSDWDTMKKEIKTMLQKHFAYNIRTMDKRQGEDAELVKASSLNLWKYMLHSDGKEFENIIIYVEDGMNDLDAEADKTSAKALIELIKKIRVNMRDIRENKTVGNTVKKFVRNMVLLGMAVFSFMLYFVFHNQYRNNAGRTVTIWTGIILILTVLATYYGWVNSALRL